MIPFIVVLVGRLLIAGFLGAAAAHLLLNGKDGWGWFLGAALLLGMVGYERKVENKNG